MVEPPDMTNSFTTEWNYSEISFVSITTEPWNYSEPWCSPGMGLKYPKSIVHIGIGPSDDVHENLFAVEYGGDRPVGSGPGGDMISVKTLLNTVTPQGVLQHNKWWEVTLGLREDEFISIYNTFMSDSLSACTMTSDNPEIPHFVIRQLGIQAGVDGVERKITYDDVYLMNVGESRIMTEDGKYLIELKFLASFRSMTGRMFYEPWGVTDPVFTHSVTEGWAYTEPPAMVNQTTEPWSS